MVGEVARNKALAIALGKAKVTDAEGNAVDLSEFTAVPDAEETAAADESVADEAVVDEAPEAETTPEAAEPEAPKKPARKRSTKKADAE
jgi:trigger factor